MHHVLFLIICAIWGSNFFLMKRAGGAFGAISVGAWRVALGAAVIAIIWRARRRSWPMRRRHVKHVVFLVAVSYLYPFTMQPHLISKSGQSAFIGMMVSLVPLLTIAVSVPMLGVWPTRRQLIGVLGGLACFVLVAYDGLTVRNLTALDMVFALGVPLTYAVGNTYIKRNLSDVPAMALTLSALLLSALILLPIGLATEPVTVGESFGVALTCLIIFGTIGTGVATVLFYKLIHDRGPLFAGMVTYIIPCVALLWGAGDREPMTAAQLAALGGILAMVALVQFEPRRAEADAPAVSEDASAKAGAGATRAAEQENSSAGDSEGTAV